MDGKQEVTFVVFYLIRVPVVSFNLPLLKLRQGKEWGGGGAFCGLDNGCDELFQKGQLEQRWPIVVNEIDQETLNVRSILILQKENIF